MAAGASEQVASPESLGVMFPSVPAMVARDGDGYVLVAPSGMRSHVRGPICRDIEESLALGAVTDGLRRLLPAHVALVQLASWLDTPAVPLTREGAVRLDGFDTMFVELLGQCNERCVHCYADAAPTVTDALEREVVMRVVEEARALGFRRIQFTGGDPLLCDFLPAAVARAAEVGFPSIEIYTNGLALTDGLLAELAPHRPSFAFSFYSMNSEVHDAVTRTPGSHRRTLAAIDRAVARGLSVRVAIVVTTQDEDVDALVGFMRARGVGFVSWSRTFSVGRGAEIAEVSQRAAANSNTASTRLAEGGGHRSSAGAVRSTSGKLCVTYTGDVVPCIFQRSSTLGNVNRGAALAEIVAGTSRAARSKHPRALPMADEARGRLQCASCRLTDLALGWLDGAR
ncbi:MAG TPA: radical SAM protein [Kofleriaceae bacterium]|nr:radical SAM protein [Kofleriaceae bacterium]